MMLWLGLFIAGGAGVICRAAIHTTMLGGHYRGTLIVNILGCLLIGILASQGEKFFGIEKTYLSLGFLGGFTTFSTFAFDSIQLFQVSPAKAFMYIAVSNIAGITACYVGFALLPKI